MKLVFKIDVRPIQEFFRIHKINWVIGALVITAIGLLLYFEKLILLYLTIILLPYLFYKKPEKSRKGTTTVQGDARPDRLNVTYLLSNFNPFTIYQVFLQLLGQLYISLKYKKRYPDAETYVNARSYTLPFDGEWFVANGGPDKHTSHSWEVLTQRYAYDFVICDNRHSTYRSDGSKLEDYYCYNKNVLSPADGRVVKVKNSIKDYEGVSSLSIDWKTPDFRGNFVIIQHADNEYSFIAHLRQGSIAVRKGDFVKRGQVIGCCGNSGHSTEPHIHFHLQDGKSMWFSMGLPIKFADISIRDQSSPRIFADGEFIEQEYYVSPISGKQE